MQGTIWQIVFGRVMLHHSTRAGGRMGCGGGRWRVGGGASRLGLTRGEAAHVRVFLTPHLKTRKLSTVYLVHARPQVGCRV